MHITGHKMAGSGSFDLRFGMSDGYHPYSYRNPKFLGSGCDDRYYHTLKLKNGTNITVTLYAYGKEAEKEIIQILSAAS